MDAVAANAGAFFGFISFNCISNHHTSCSLLRVLPNPLGGNDVSCGSILNPPDDNQFGTPPMPDREVVSPSTFANNVMGSADDLIRPLVGFMGEVVRNQAAIQAPGTPHRNARTPATPSRNILPR